MSTKHARKKHKEKDSAAAPTTTALIDPRLMTAEERKAMKKGIREQEKRDKEEGM